MKSPPAFFTGPITAATCVPTRSRFGRKRVSGLRGNVQEPMTIVSLQHDFFRRHHPPSGAYLVTMNALSGRSCRGRAGQ
jgi:hypothetical protein